jgi:AraC-like DNA-binding protein
VPPRHRRMELSTADPAAAREFLNRTYGGRLRLIGAGPGAVVVAVTHTDAGLFAVSDMRLAADLTFAVSGCEAVIVSTVTHGTVQAARAGGSDRYERGDVLLGSLPQCSYTAHTHDLRARHVILPLSLFQSVADAEPTLSGPPRFLSPHPIRPAAGARWRNASSYVDSLLDDPEAAASPLIVSSAARLLAATALAVFPNSATAIPNTAVPNAATADPGPPDQAGASTPTLRRAVSFIDEHADRDIGIADIAAAAYVTIRAVQLAFRRHLGTTPLAYLRRVRLDRAHRQLVAADPSRESVSAVAYRWGFASPSRFADYYRRVYGVQPSNTLRT